MTTIELMERLRQRYKRPAWAFIEAVRNGTGDARKARTADAIAMSLWPSHGLHLHGFEVKVSRGDWLRELKHPEKAEEIARFCHFWWIVAPPGVIDESLMGPELPANWGFLRVDEKKITVVREASKLPAEPPDHLLLAAILRRTCAADQAKLDEARIQGKAEGVEEGKERADYGNKFQMEQFKRLKESLEAFQEKSGIEISTYNGAHIGEAVKIVTRGGLESRLRRLGEAARDISAEVEKAIGEMEDPGRGSQDKRATMSKKINA